MIHRFGSEFLSPNHLNDLYDQPFPDGGRELREAVDQIFGDRPVQLRLVLQGAGPL